MQIIGALEKFLKWINIFICKIDFYTFVLN